LTAVLLGLSFTTGALQARAVPHGWQLSAYDTKNVRRFALTVTGQQRPDIALFDSRGRRIVLDP
jgi:hypothetical protein